jgi:hypothetical protein
MSQISSGAPSLQPSPTIRTAHTRFPRSHTATARRSCRRPAKKSTGAVRFTRHMRRRASYARRGPAASSSVTSWSRSAVLASVPGCRSGFGSLEGRDRNSQPRHACGSSQASSRQGLALVQVPDSTSAGGDWSTRPSAGMISAVQTTMACRLREAAGVRHLLRRGSTVVSTHRLGLAGRRLGVEAGGQQRVRRDRRGSWLEWADWRGDS